MNTPKCCGPVIKNQAGGKEFFVCQTCKKEPDERPEGINSEAALVFYGRSFNIAKYLQQHTPLPPLNSSNSHRFVINSLTLNVECDDCGISHSAIGALGTCPGSPPWQVSPQAPVGASGATSACHRWKVDTSGMVAVCSCCGISASSRLSMQSCPGTPNPQVSP